MARRYSRKRTKRKYTRRRSSRGVRSTRRGVRLRGQYPRRDTARRLRLARPRRVPDLRVSAPMASAHAVSATWRCRCDGATIAAPQFVVPFDGERYLLQPSGPGTDLLPNVTLSKNWEEYKELFREWRITMVHLDIRLEADKLFGLDEDVNGNSSLEMAEQMSTLRAAFKKYLNTVRFAYTPLSSVADLRPTSMVNEGGDVNYDAIRTLPLSQDKPTRISFPYVMFKREEYMNNMDPAGGEPDIYSRIRPVPHPWRPTKPIVSGSTDDDDLYPRPVMPEWGVLFDRTFRFNVTAGVNSYPAFFNFDYDVIYDIEFRGRS